MSKTKRMLMLTSAILMIVSGVITGILCCLYIFQPERLEPIIEKFAKDDVSNWDNVAQMVQLVISMATSGSVVGIVFGGISIRFCMWSAVDFYEKKSVVLTVAIICTMVVNPLVGILYIIAVLMKDENLNFDEEEEETQKPVDIDKIMEKIEKLNKMKEQNIINQEEFDRLKADILKGTGLDKKSK
ncbi:MAG: SHOCT domain-containing protein [Clostridia bacterium]|nr:SHOCT domain-containing protein [Clostridia bacterium]